jgi:predicted phage baseplate assembly protein
MLPLPILDDRGFEQILADVKRRIPVHTPEWTNFDGESDPGITLVELFAYIADIVLYRANRVPELNRRKFLQLMGLRLHPATAAQGLIVVRNERGPVEARPFDRGLVVSAGRVDFLTRDGVTVLPVEGRVFSKRPLGTADPRLGELQARHEAVQIAMEAAGDVIADGTDEADFVFYDSVALGAPAAGAPEPVVDLVADTLDRSLYVALLGPREVDPAEVRTAIANEVLSIGIAPVLADTVPALRPLGARSARDATPRLVYEIIDRPDAAAGARWSRLTVVQDPDVLSEVGIVQLQLPEAARLSTGTVSDPLLQGVDDLPPRIDDDQLRSRLVTWIRLRLAPGAAAASASARVAWAGVNATRVVQAVPVTAELVGVGSGEPDQSFALAHRPVLPASLRLVVEGDLGIELWRQTEDLAGLPYDDRAFTLDPAAGTVTFGGPEGARPGAGRRIFATYEYGGGLEGNVAIGAIKTSTDPAVAGFVVENPIATWGGDLAETVVEAERTLPAVLRHRERLVTDQDFRDVTLRTPGVDVGRVDVLSLFTPDAPKAESAGVVTVMVVPSFDSARPRWPTPDRLFLRTVCDHLDVRRLVTTELYVRGPVYLDTYVTIGISTQAGWFPDIVRQAVRDRMYEYLSSLPPGGAAGGGWELGRTILRKDLEAIATRVPGVAFVRSIRLGVTSGEDTESWTLSGLELPVLRNIGVVEGEAEPLSAIIAGGTTGTPARQVPVPVDPEAC